MSVENQLQEIVEKLKKIVQHNQKLYQTLQNQAKTIHILENQLIEKKSALTNCENQLEILRLAQKISKNNTFDSKPSKDLKKIENKINDVIKEIDNCVAMLNN